MLQCKQRDKDIQGCLCCSAEAPCQRQVLLTKTPGPPGPANQPPPLQRPNFSEIPESHQRPRRLLITARVANSKRFRRGITNPHDVRAKDREASARVGGRLRLSLVIVDGHAPGLPRARLPTDDRRILPAASLLGDDAPAVQARPDAHIDPARRRALAQRAVRQEGHDRLAADPQEDSDGDGATGWVNEANPGLLSETGMRKMACGRLTRGFSCAGSLNLEIPEYLNIDHDEQARRVVMSVRDRNEKKQREMWGMAALCLHSRSSITPSG